MTSKVSNEDFVDQITYDSDRVSRFRRRLIKVEQRLDALEQMIDERNEEVSQNLLEVLRRFEEAESNSDIQLAISSLRDIMELIPDRKPLPWESDDD